MKTRIAFTIALLIAILPVGTVNAADFTFTRDDPMLNWTNLSLSVTQIEVQARYAQDEANVPAATYGPLDIITVGPVNWMQKRVQLTPTLDPGIEKYFVEFQYRLHYPDETKEWCYPGVGSVNLRPNCATFTATD